MPYSNDKHEMTIPAGCPWHNAQQTLGAPNVNWCEDTHCTWINEPANTWSNLGYILVGIYIIRKLQQSHLRLFGWLVMLMGIFSFTYHATNNFFTQTIDFVGMFLMMSFLFAFHLKRILPPWGCNFFATFWFFMFLNTFIFLSFGIFNQPVQIIMLMNALPIMALDIIAGAREGHVKEYKYFILSTTLLIIAQGFAILDIQRIYCKPDNLWLHGHVIWHLLGGFAMLFAGLHMEKIMKLKQSK